MNKIIWLIVLLFMSIESRLQELDNLGLGITHSKDSNNFLLNITDNGTGLPKNYDVTKKASFGIRLMQGLSKQMGGSFKIENDNGVKIEVAFTESELAKLISNKNNKIYALQGVVDE